MTLKQICQRYKISRSQAAYLLKGAGIKPSKIEWDNRIKLTYPKNEVLKLFSKLKEEYHD